MIYLIDREKLINELNILINNNKALIDQWLVYSIEDVIDDQPIIKTIEE